MPKTVTPLQNTVRTYAWGSTSAIAKMQGRPVPTKEPEAELWIGAHPTAPSKLQVDGETRSLIDVVAEAPAKILGEQTVERFGERLPFLLKILAACEPLSIQAHPDLEQARAGFARERDAGLSSDDPRRGYPDQNHKPEIIYALTAFHLVAGFRSLAEISETAARLGLSDVLPAAETLRGGAQESSAYSELLRAWLALPRNAPQTLRALEIVADRDDPEAVWMRRLHKAHSGDRGVFAPVLLHLMELQPGEALYTGPGILHAYLDGVGVELMASSDNVLRGALTVKHVDVEALTEILLPRPHRPEILTPRSVGLGETLFDAPVEDFALAHLELREEPVERTVNSVEILLVTRGNATLRDAQGTVDLRAGDAALIPAATGSYRLQGSGEAFRASVPTSASSA